MRTVVQNKGVLRTLLLSVFVLGVATILPTSLRAAGVPSDYETLAQGDHGQIITESDLVVIIDNNEELLRFYQALGIESFPPDLNMEETTVVAAVASPRPASGYAVQILRLFPDVDNALILEVLESVPADPCTPLTVETIPFHVVAFPSRIDKKAVRIRWDVVEVKCP